MPYFRQEHEMPNRDGTGPLGQGILTGRGLGPCGRGLAFGRGFRWRKIIPKEEVELTKDEEKKILEAEKKEIEKRLKELKS